MSSSLKDLKSRIRDKPDEAIEAYQRALNECPPVSSALLAYLDKMFARRKIKPNDPTMQQELVFQAGIDNVVMHLRSQNERQERNVKQIRTK